MKKLMMMLVAACAAAVSLAAPFEVGYSPDAFANAAKITGAIAVSTNASEVVTVKAVYEFPVYGKVTRQFVKQEKVEQIAWSVGTYTNWTDSVTTNYVVVGGVTNYYDGVIVETNALPRWVTVPVTNTWTETVLTGKRCVTNDLYSITCSGGVGQSTDAKLVGTGAGILVTGAAVDLLTE